MGTTSEQVVRHASVDVMVARPGTEGPVVVATDLSEAAMAAVERGAEEARLRKAPLIAVHCIEFAHPAFTAFEPSLIVDEVTLAAMREAAERTLRGQMDEVALYEVLWQPEDATNMLPKLDLRDAEPERPSKLVLRFQGQEVVLDPEQKRSVTMGRGDDNDVTIKGNLISRVHARIELNKSRYVIIDESTNGTFVQRDDGEEVYVRRDTAHLSGTGLIGLGRVASRGMPLSIEYSFDSD